MKHYQVRRITKATRLLSKDISNLLELLAAIIIIAGQTVSRAKVIKNKIKARKDGDKDERTDDN